ncbi:MAG: hypothetical protein ACLFWM_02910 [Actinomycetota bacterium]
MSRLLIFAAWLVAAVAASAVAWAALDSADRQLGSGPAVVEVPSDSASPPAPTTSAAGASSPADPTSPDATPASTSSSAPGVSSPAGSTPGSDGPAPTTTSTATPAGSGATTSTTTSTSTTTTTTTTTPEQETTTTAGAWTGLTVPSGGGVVVVSHRPGEVRLESATPAPGYAMEIDHRGPDEVRVEFEGQSDEYRIRVRWRDGALDTEVERG